MYKSIYLERESIFVTACKKTEDIFPENVEFLQES